MNSEHNPEPIWRRYARFFGHDTAADVRDELDFHIESKIADLTAAGLAPEAARREALRQFGRIHEIEDIGIHMGDKMQRSQRLADYWNDLRQDIRYTLRTLRRDLGFTTVAIVTLALGIGANTAIYSIIHGALRLPYPHAERMVAVKNVFPQGQYYSASYPDFLDWRAKTASFAQLVASFSSRATWNGASFGKTEPEAVGTGLVSQGFFTMFGERPVVGRDFLAAEYQMGSAPVCLLAESFWHDELHADPRVVGRSLDLDDKSCTVVGVMPDFKPAGRPVGVWLPLETNKPYDQQGSNYLFVRGLLRPGVSIEKARAELATVQAGIDKQFPGNAHGVALHPLSEAVFGDLRRVLQVLMAAVGFILLIACVNLANMLLARASDREHEFALRRALGASSRRLLRQTLTESLLLSFAGTLAGIGIAVGLTHIPIAAWPREFTAPADVHLDGAILAFSGVLGITTGILAGCIPALRVMRQKESSSLQPTRGTTESRGQGRTRSALVISEIALCMLLVISALDVAMHFAALLKASPGVIAHNAMVMTVTLPTKQYPTADDQHRFYHALVGKLSSLPGVTAVGGSMDTPFTGSDSNGAFRYEGQAANAASKNPFTEEHYITPAYFAAIGAQFWQGRDFSNQDQANTPPVIIINRSMAVKLWPGQNPIGKKINSDADGKWRSVIGVVNDIQFDGPGEPPAYQVYLPIDQLPYSFTNLSFVLRTAANFGTDPLSLSEPVRAAVVSINPKLAVSNITSLDALSQEAFSGQRTSTTVMSILGALALWLASIGIYGMMAYSVSRREREFGICIALGANRTRILRLLYATVFRLVFGGMTLGILLAYAAHVWIASMLGTKGTSPLAIILGGLLLSGIAAAAAAAPASRALHILPMEALRNE